MKRFFNSIRWRLQAWHGLILFVVITAFCVTAYQLAKDNFDRRVFRDLHRLEGRLFRGVMQTYRDQNGEDRPFDPKQILTWLQSTDLILPEDTAAAFQGTEPGYAYFVFIDVDGNIIHRSPNAPDDVEARAKEGFPFRSREAIGTRRETMGGPPDGARSIVGRDVQPELDDLHRLTLSLIASGIGVWALGLIGGWWLAGRAIKPIASISSTASRIADGNLSERIDTLGTDNELDQLAHVLNQTFERLNEAFTRQRQFTADASHELRTPVTILLSETQRILKRERSPEEYREAIEACRDSAIRMRNLTEALLTLSRQESGKTGKHDCDLATIVSEQIKQLEPIAREKAITIHNKLSPASLTGDSDALSILVHNLIANAIQHNDPGGEVTVVTSQDSGYTRLSVSDNGPGISQEDLPHLFERFYRADKARTGTSGHTGLGLAIAQTIAKNHNSEVTVESKRGQGTRFTVTFPV